MDTYHWDVLVTHHWEVVGCFILDVVETYWWDVVVTPFKTSSRRSNKTWWRRTTETSWRRSTETSLGVSFGMYLRRHWDIQSDIARTSPRRLISGWELSVRASMMERSCKNNKMKCNVFVQVVTLNTEP